MIELDLLYSALRLATPLLLAALGGLLAERAGVVTICLEGVMLVAAWAAATATFLSHSVVVGLLAGIVAGVLLILLHAFLVIRTKSDAIVSGVAINLLASGITPVLTKAFFGNSTNTPSVPQDERLPLWVLITFALLLPFALQHWLYRTGGGLRLRAAGEGPGSLTTAGVSVAKTQVFAVSLAGVLAAGAGIFLSLAHSGQFTRDMTAGRGYIALTALIFGRWKPLPTLITALFFGFTEAVQIQIQGAAWLPEAFPIQAIQAFPYLVTLVVLAGLPRK